VPRPVSVAGAASSLPHPPASWVGAATDVPPAGAASLRWAPSGWSRLCREPHARAGSV